MFLLAQTNGATPTPGDAIGWAERMQKGGVPLICLCVAIAAVVGLIFMFKKLFDERKERTVLEENYRKAIDDERKAEKVEAEKRLVDAKQEAKDRAIEYDKLMRERMAVQKDSDTTLAHAVRAIEESVELFRDVKELLNRKRG